MLPGDTAEAACLLLAGTMPSAFHQNTTTHKALLPTRTFARDAIIRSGASILVGVDTTEKQHTVKAVVRKGERYYVAECIELAVVTHGKTVDETLANLKEAVALHLEGEDPADFGLVPNPTIVITMELEPAVA